MKTCFTYILVLFLVLWYIATDIIPWTSTGSIEKVISMLKIWKYKSWKKGMNSQNHWFFSSNIKFGERGS